MPLLLPTQAPLENAAVVIVFTHITVVAVMGFSIHPPADLWVAMSAVTAVFADVVVATSRATSVNVPGFVVIVELPDETVTGTGTPPALPWIVSAVV
jgi:hypothetical protein